MAVEYFERGGLRWGRGIWRYEGNVTWPFATLRLTTDHIELRTCGFAVRGKFYFEASEVKAVHTCHGLINSGIQIEHAIADWPPVVIFWTLHLRRLVAAARDAGYVVCEE